MSSLYTHHGNPLTPEEWRRLQGVVVEAARRTLVGRRVVDIHGPVGPGAETIVKSHLAGTTRGHIDLQGNDAGDAVRSARREPGFLPIVYKDFVVHWRDLETARATGVPFDTSIAAGAASLCANREDQLILFGHETMGYEGLMNATGRLTLLRRDWSASGNAFADVSGATERLVERGHYGPYSMIVSPRLYAQMHRVHQDTNVLEIEHVRKLVSGGVYQSALIRTEAALLVSGGRQNFDLVVGQDLTVAYLGAAQMNHPFRVFESIGLRIKRPSSICTLE